VESAEDISLDAPLQALCAAELAALCSDVGYGSGARLACLKDNRPKLGPKCSTEVFRREVRVQRRKGRDPKGWSAGLLALGSKGKPVPRSHQGIDMVGCGLFGEQAASVVGADVTGYGIRLQRVSRCGAGTLRHA
jgi:hypothetical protein